MNIASALTSSVVARACELRYEVFVHECGDQRYANHALRSHRDSFDFPNSNLFIAYENDEIIGTLRLILCRNGPYIQEEKCGYDQLAVKVGLSVREMIPFTGFITRGAIAKPFRGKGIFSALSQHLEREAFRQGLRYIIGVVGEHNDPSSALLSRRGYVPYHTTIFETKLASNVHCQNS